MTPGQTVDRYTVTRNENGLGFSNGIEPDAAGGFVSYEDYLAQREQIEALQKRVKAADAEKLAIAQKFDEFHSDPALMARIIMTSIERDADNEALRAQLAAAQAQLASDPDRSVYVANHRQAACIHLTAQALGPDYSATIKGLPKAAKHVASLLSEVQAQAQTARNDALREAAKLAWDMEAKYLRKQYVVDHNRKRYDISGVERCENKTANVISEDIHNAILALIYKDTSR